MKNVRLLNYLRNSEIKLTIIAKISSQSMRKRLRTILKAKSSMFIGKLNNSIVQNWVDEYLKKKKKIFEILRDCF